MNLLIPELVKIEAKRILFIPQIWKIEAGGINFLESIPGLHKSFRNSTSVRFKMIFFWSKRRKTNIVVPQLRKEQRKTNFSFLYYQRNKKKPKYLFLNLPRNEDEAKYSFSTIDDLTLLYRTQAPDENLKIESRRYSH